MHKTKMEREEQKLAEEKFAFISAHLACQLSSLQAAYSARMGLTLTQALSKQQHRVYNNIQSSMQVTDLPALVDLVCEMKAEVCLRAVSPTGRIAICKLGVETARNDREKEQLRCRKIAFWVAEWLIPVRDLFVLIALTHAFDLECYDLLLLVKLAQSKECDIAVDVCVEGHPIDLPRAAASEIYKRRGSSLRKRN